MAQPDIPYAYDDSEAAFTAAYLMPTVVRVLTRALSPPARIFELGCGNGANARHLASLGYDVTGVDPSPSAIDHAPKSAGVRLSLGSTDDDLAERYGRFPAVISLEVVEHCVSVRRYADCLRSLVEPGGVAIVSTPYHGYIKNLAVIGAGKFDNHFNPLWEGGHLHFFSIPTLREMFRRAGFNHCEFYRVGRVPMLAKSVIAVAQ